MYFLLYIVLILVYIINLHSLKLNTIIIIIIYYLHLRLLHIKKFPQLR
jgi:hypothetical protein